MTDHWQLEGQTIGLDASRPAYYYVQYLISSVWSKAESLWGVKVGRIGYCRDNMVQWYLADKGEESYDPVLDSVLYGPSKLLYLEQAITRSRRSLIKPFETVSFPSMSNVELINFFNAYYRQLGLLYRYSGFLRCLDHALTQALERVLGDVPDREELIRLISIGKRPSFTHEEHSKALELAVSMKKLNLRLNDPVVQRAIQDLVDQYCWMNGGQTKTREYLFSSLKQVLRHDPASLLEEEDRQRSQDLRRRRYLVKQLRPMARQLVRISSRAVWLKEYCKYSKNKSLYYSNQLFEELAKRLGKTTGFIKDLLPGELIDLLNGLTIDEQLVAARSHESVIYGKDGTVEYVIGEEARAVAKMYLQDSSEQTDTLHGRVVSRGSATGRSVVIKGRKDFSKVRANDIIIVTNTTPNYIQIIQQAAGIVAEEGGLTSHVAVLSREFGIPCIVGVRGATQIIHDGQLVILDGAQATVVLSAIES